MISRLAWAPLRVFLVVLLIVFLAEAGVMLLLPILLPAEVDEWTKALVDSCLLTLFTAPIIWWLLVRPWQRSALVRRDVLKQLVTAQEDERRRIARDLHDGIGQSLTSLLVGLRTLAETATPEAVREQTLGLRNITLAALEEVRRLARGLRPSALDDQGLGAALEDYVEDYARAYGIALTLQIPEDLGERRLPEMVETALYRMVQEALTNTAKHAAAKKVRIVLDRRPWYVDLSIEDDGRGFNPQGVLRPFGGSRHFGLSSMRERAALLGGTLTISSRPRAGTQVRIRLPLKEVNIHGEDPRTAGR